VRIDIFLALSAWDIYCHRDINCEFDQGSSTIDENKDASRAFIVLTSSCFFYFTRRKHLFNGNDRRRNAIPEHAILLNASCDVDFRACMYIYTHILSKRKRMEENKKREARKKRETRKSQNRCNNCLRAMFSINLHKHRYAPFISSNPLFQDSFSLFYWYAMKSQASFLFCFSVPANKCILDASNQVWYECDAKNVALYDILYHTTECFCNISLFLPAHVRLYYIDRNQISLLNLLKRKGTREILIICFTLHGSHQKDVLHFLCFFLLLSAREILG